MIKYTVLGLALLVGGYFGFGMVKKWQRDFNAKADQAAKESDGGQLGHIAELHSVLDATDPNRFHAEESQLNDMAARQALAAAQASGAGMYSAPQPMPERDLPVIPPVWTLESSGVKIPDGRANGSISGTNFVVDAALLSRTAQSYVLSLREGDGPTPEREIQVFLRPDSAGTVLGRTWDLGVERTPQSPRVAKRWKVDPRYAPRQRTFVSGYVMKLELGQVKDQLIPGKIYLALPDEEHSVVAGRFSVRVAAPAAEMMESGF